MEIIEKMAQSLLQLVMDDAPDDNHQMQLILQQAQQDLPQDTALGAADDVYKLHQIARRDKTITVNNLEYLINKYFRSLAVARLIARHPSVDLPWLAHFMHFLPDDAKANSCHEMYQADARWPIYLKDARPSDPIDYFQYTPEENLRRAAIAEDCPWTYKASYWLEHGDTAAKRHIIGLDKVDESFIASFADDKSVHIRKDLARRTNLSVPLAEKLSQDKAVSVRQALAENIACPPAVLSVLTDDSDPKVQAAALHNPACPADTVLSKKLATALKPSAAPTSAAQLASREIIELLGTLSTDSDTLAGLATHADAYVRAGVALHANCTIEVLRQLAKDSVAMVRSSVAFNPRTPADILQSYIDSGDKGYQLALASNPSLTESQQLQLATVAQDHIRVILADTTDLESVWLALRDSPATAATDSPDSQWRESLKVLLDAGGKGLYALQRGTSTRQLFVGKLTARHNKCPEGLIGHYAYYLYDSLVQNPNIALRVLENPAAIRGEPYADWLVDQWLSKGEAPGHVANFYLRSDDIKLCRKAVDNWTASIRYIQPLVFSCDLLLRKRLAERQGNTQFMLEVLARDSKEAVRELVAKNIETPASILQELSTDKVNAVRVAATQNSNFIAASTTASAPAAAEQLRNKGPKKSRVRMATEALAADVLRDLAMDKDEDVRVAVAGNQSTPSDVLDFMARDTSAAVRERVAAHAHTSFPVTMQLFSDNDAAVRASALFSAYDLVESKNKNKSAAAANTAEAVSCESILAAFYDDCADRILGFVARHTSNIEVQDRLAQDGSTDVLVDLANNRHLDSTVAKVVISRNQTRAISLLIENTSDEEVYFAALDVRGSFQKNPCRNTPMIRKPEIQRRLATHKLPSVRAAVAEYIQDKELMLLLANDNDENVRNELCHNRTLQTIHLSALLQRPTIAIVRMLIRNNSSLANEPIAEMLKQAEDDMRTFVARECTLTDDWESLLRSDSSTEVRKGLARNKNHRLSEQTQRILSEDPDESVRRIMAGR